MANNNNNPGIAGITPQQAITVTNPQGVARRLPSTNVEPRAFTRGIPTAGVISKAPVGRTPGAQRRANRRVTAYNTAVPMFYRVAVDGRPGRIVFPTPGAKLYYLKCIKTAANSYPIDIAAYSVINNRAYFLIASYDQTPVSYRRFFDMANALYAQFFNNNFQTSGFVFKSKIRVKQLKKLEDICESIPIIESQPYAHLLAQRWDYPFSSYGKQGDFDSGFIACRESIYKLADKDQVEKLILQFYKDGELGEGGLRVIPEDVFNLPEVDRITTLIENVLIDYGCYTKRAIPNYLMPRVIAEINERSGLEYDRIAYRLALSKRDKYPTLVKVIAELAVTMNQSFDESVKSLEVETNDNALLRDVVVELSDRLGYSIDQIFARLGIAYCTVSGNSVHYFNDAFVVEIIKFICETKKISPEFAIQKLGIRNSHEDPNRVLKVAQMCRK